jgi:hypothetical protein
MRLPKQGSSYRNHVDFGRYVAARLHQAKREDLAADVERMSQTVKEKGRDWEDASEFISSCTARRDSADEALDSLAKTFRLKLASRSVGADKVAPYTSVFPKGVAYYTASPLPENQARYRELLSRATSELPANDDALTTLQQALPELVDTFTKAVTELDTARTKASLARTALDVSIDNWVVQIEKTYGALAAELTRSGADRFFPKSSGSPVIEEPSTAPTV